MPDIREEFEEYIAGVRERVEARGFEPLGDAIEKWMLHAWQASRAALRVELPERRDPLNSTGDDENPRSSGFNACLERVKEALQQAGIEVAE
ncbi:hypothetical protein EQH76_34510 [Pseudomonas aeruginosa]|uniref:hypothetical protein n=1 Tax=Pseudomonas aeruginosa TaxID=287 RepID=UPI000FF07063|nr:hypothetical protein [Pseudomonas aeruginosa]RWY15230.1 hypothetical protein EQH76_34510 [Pseudomonas aeruginosa]